MDNSALIPAKSATLGSTLCASNLLTCSASPFMAARCKGVSPLSFLSRDRKVVVPPGLREPAWLPDDVICIKRAICWRSDIGVTGGARPPVPEPFGRINDGILHQKIYNNKLASNCKGDFVLNAKNRVN